MEDRGIDDVSMMTMLTSSSHDDSESRRLRKRKAMVNRMDNEGTLDESDRFMHKISIVKGLSGRSFPSKRILNENNNRQNLSSHNQLHGKGSDDSHCTVRHHQMTLHQLRHQQMHDMNMKMYKKLLENNRQVKVEKDAGECMKGMAGFSSTEINLSSTPNSSVYISPMESLVSSQNAFHETRHQAYSATTSDKVASSDEEMIESSAEESRSSFRTFDMLRKPTNAENQMDIVTSNDASGGFCSHCGYGKKWATILITTSSTACPC